MKNPLRLGRFDFLDVIPPPRAARIVIKNFEDSHLCMCLSNDHWFKLSDLLLLLPMIEAAS